MGKPQQPRSLAKCLSSTVKQGSGVIAQQLMKGAGSLHQINKETGLLHKLNKETGFTTQ